MERQEVIDKNTGKSEYNISAVKGQPIENTYNNAGDHHQRMTEYVTQDLMTDAKANQMFYKHRVHLMGDHFDTSSKLSHYDTKMYRNRPSLLQ